MRTHSCVLPLIVLLVCSLQKRCIHFVLHSDHYFYNFRGASMTHFGLISENGALSAPSIFRFLTSISTKLVAFFVFISIENFRVLGPSHCHRNVFWCISNMTCFVSICGPVGQQAHFLHYRI
jgi:hypothetical protein